MEFKDWFFKQFPEYYQESDTYKDINGEGLFQRYLRTFGLELDESIMPYVHNFVDIVDYEKCDDKYLPLLAAILGSPPSFGPNNDEYRKILGYAVSIYKVKGTYLAYQLLFSILGIEIKVLDLTPKKKITYDQEGVIYDEVDPYTYDSICETCSGYYIGYVLPQGWTMGEAETIQKLNRVICFLQPIHAKFLGFISMQSISDNYTQPITDTINTEIP